VALLGTEAPTLAHNPDRPSRTISSMRL
jgi:hypothetical protein